MALCVSGVTWTTLPQKVASVWTDTQAWSTIQTMPTNAKSLSQVIGESLRAIRTGRSERQDEVAADARGYGLDWTRATVAAIETGKRELRPGELVLLPWIYGVELGELIPADAHVRLGPNATASGKAVSAALRGAGLEQRMGEFEFPVKEQLRVGMQALADRFRKLSRISPTLGEVEDAEADAAGEVEQRAADRLGVDALHLALLARRRWGHSLTTERDRRAPDDVRSRGHITRTLLSELQPDLEAANLLKRRSRRGAR